MITETADSICKGAVGVPTDIRKFGQGACEEPPELTDESL
jgi:hypothetical protein